MLWLALLLPALPLQLAERALPCIGPLAIVEGPPQRLAVIHCNTAARAAGVAPGMLSCIRRALDHIGAFSNRPLRLQDIPSECPQVYDMHSATYFI